MTLSPILSAVSHFSQSAKGQPPPRIFAGADGFVDEIIKVVDKRQDVNNFTPMRTIAEYASRLAQAAGKSTNVEFVVEQIKLGGNGPLMCEAMGRLGGYVRYVGCVGWPNVHPLFTTLEQYGPVTTIASPGITLATEFEDGKIMHGKHESLRDVTWSNMVERLGGLDVIDSYLLETDLVAIVNWTMLPFLTDVFHGMRERVIALGSNAPRYYFFDLCDPQKRTREHIAEALEAIAGFTAPGRTVVLGLNEKESTEVCDALQLYAGDATKDGLLERAKRIVERLGLSEVVIHPTQLAVAYSPGNSGSVDGPFCTKPKLTTGAGDHFNGGYMFARVLGLSPAEAVVIGKCVSGFYVRQGRGPSADEIVLFGERWANGRLDPWQVVV